MCKPGPEVLVPSLEEWGSEERRVEAGGNSTHRAMEMDESQHIQELKSIWHCWGEEIYGGS